MLVFSGCVMMEGGGDGRDTGKTTMGVLPRSPSEPGSSHRRMSSPGAASSSSRIPQPPRGLPRKGILKRSTSMQVTSTLPFSHSTREVLMTLQSRSGVGGGLGRGSEGRSSLRGYTPPRASSSPLDDEDKAKESRIPKLAKVTWCRGQPYLSFPFTHHVAVFCLNPLKNEQVLRL